MKTISAILACVMLAACVTSTPVNPVATMEEMGYLNSCYFACNICFDTDLPLMLSCANKACSGGELGLAWMAESCNGHHDAFVREFLKHALSNKHWMSAQ